MRTNGFNIYLGPTNSTSGYGGLQKKIIKSFITHHKVNCALVNPPIYLQDFQKCEDWYKEFACNWTSNKIKVFNKCLSMNYPSQVGALEDQTSFVYTMFENEKVPDALIRALNKHDYLIVPCEHNAKLFKNSGFDKPIFKVPLGNDNSQYHFVDRNWNISEDNPFTFLNIGAMNWRKGYDVAIKAFKRVFPREQRDVRLVLKISKQYTPQWQINGMRTEDDRIILVKEHLSDDEMLNLYQASHCNLAPSRGDAWNLLAFQSLATGCPAITTNYCGPEEYQHLSYPLNYDMKYCNEKVFEEDWGYYGEPNMDHLCELMEFCFKNPGKCRLKGIEASNEIKVKFTWDETARKLLDVINNNS